MLLEKKSIFTQIGRLHINMEYCKLYYILLVKVGGSLISLLFVVECYGNKMYIIYHYV